MGTTAEKGQRVLQSIAEVQEGINNIGGSLTDQTPFKNFRVALDNIYNNLPKTDYEEGSNITLSNCLKGKLDFEDDKVGYGDTTQESTTGKNKFNVTNYDTNIWSNNYATNIVKTEDSISFDCSARIRGVYINPSNLSNVVDNLDTTKTYYISIDIETDIASQFYWGSANLRTTNLNVGSQRISISDKLTTNLMFYTLYDSGTVHYKISKIMISEASDTNYEPYTNGPAPNPTYPFPVKCVTGEQDITIRGKNIAKLDQTYNTNNAQIIYSENVPSSIVGTKTQQVGQFLATFTGQIEKGKTYTIGGNATQCYVYAYSDNIGGTIINSIQNLPLPVTFTANYTGFCLFALYFRSLDTGTASIKNFQVEEGSATDYEPYITPITKTLSLGNLEFAEIGTYRDYIWTDRSTGKWYKHSAIDKLIIDSNLTVTFSTSTTGYDLVRIDNISAPNVERPIMSSSFIGIIPEYGSGSVITNRSANNIYINYLISKIDICTVKNAYSSGSDFLTKLNGTTIYLAKTTTTDTEITDTLLINQLEEWYNMSSISGTTIIETSGNLPILIKARALKGE